MEGSSFSLWSIEKLGNIKNRGKPAKFNASANLENTMCGDDVTVYLSIQDNRIKDASFEGEGCSATVAAADALMEFIKSKEVDEVVSFGSDFMESLLNVKIEPSRSRCVNLGLRAVKAAIAEYSKSATS
ncbi:MAG: iron-sulfur cluster assembly scaffold protein [Candidatus Micrarchaeales archaeon]|jgi:nitrogen fixation NifU-like protein|uniref:Nitrogen-fixing NifU domain protein n=1 Tax=Candidatus Micrarchaeum acidiphilum ARMAN-2 TaxID=425595 RepID=C7DHB6_MICA2|nr:MAG: nitrogen-fixing NifU domain protein [Candidatus Micrarchaeum acidiphilum ARMAN-2]MCW6160585.1 iron-sulfur cluster assembly scaffold protein [Candidatus Micrarchaeales archaeon]